MPAAMVYLAMVSESSTVLKLDSSDVVRWLFRQLETHQAPFLSDALALMSEQRPLIYLPPAGIARQVNSIRLLARENFSSQLLERDADSEAVTGVSKAGVRCTVKTSSFRLAKAKKTHSGKQTR
jgi:hypothetical protein